MKKFILCYILGLHNWTSKSMRGEPIEDLTGDFFLDYAKIKQHEYVYCECCGQPDRLN